MSCAKPCGNTKEGVRFCSGNSGYCSGNLTPAGTVKLRLRRSGGLAEELGRARPAGAIRTDCRSGGQDKARDRDRRDVPGRFRTARGPGINQDEANATPAQANGRETGRGRHRRPRAAPPFPPARQRSERHPRTKRTGAVSRGECPARRGVPYPPRLSAGAERPSQRQRRDRAERPPKPNERPTGTSEGRGPTEGSDPRQTRRHRAGRRQQGDSGALRPNGHPRQKKPGPSARKEGR